MKLSLLFFITFLLFSQNIQSQGFAIGTDNPDPNAILDIVSTNKGILIPRLTTAQRNAITGLGVTQQGLLVYNTQTDEFNYWDGTAWIAFPSGSADWTLTGNAGTNPATNFIGTTDNQELAIRTNNTEKLRITTKGQVETYNTGQSVFIGEEAGENDDLSSNQNVSIGYQAGRNNISSNKNIAIGFQALELNTGDSQTALGWNALSLNSSGSQNTGLGYSALRYNTTGDQNVAVGYQSLTDNKTGNNNTAVGRLSLHDNTSGSNNTASGQQSLTNNTNGVDNTAAGFYSLLLNTAGDNNVAFGSRSGLVSKGDENTYIGFGAGNSDNTANRNVYVGALAGAGSYDLMSGTGGENKSDNIFIGYRSGYNESGSSKLYIENSDNANPLIYGEFDNNIARINGELQVSDPAVSGYAFPTNDGTADFILQTDGNGQLGWVDPSTFASATEWTDGGSYLYPTDGTIESISLGSNIDGIGQLNITPNNKFTGLNIDNDYSVGFDIEGIRNFVNNDGNGDAYGINSNVSGSGTGIKYGVYAQIPPTAGGLHYGIYSEATKASGAWAGYFLGDVSIGTTTANTFTFPASRGSNGDVMQTNATGQLSWVNPSTFASNDHDFYEIGGTNAPNDINDNIFHLGNIAVGKNSTSYKLDVLTTNQSRAINTSISGTGNLGLTAGHYITNSHSGSSPNYGQHIDMTGTGTNWQTGVRVDIDNTGTSAKTGFWLETSGTGTGNKTGLFAHIQNANSGNNYGVHTIMSSGSTLANLHGTFSELSGPTHGTQYGSRSQMTGTGNGIHYGVYNYLNGTGSGAKYGSYANITSTAGGTHYGVYSSVLKSSNAWAGYFLGDVSIGTTTANIYTLPASRGANGEVMQTNASGQITWVDPATFATTEWIDGGTYLRPGDGTSEDISIGKTAAPNGRLDISTTKNYGLYIDNRQTGSSPSTSSFNTFPTFATTTGTKTAVYNVFASTAAGTQTGVESTFYNLSNADKIGVSNRFNGISSGDIRGVNNVIYLSNATGESIGTNNSLSNDGTSTQYGTKNTLGGNATGDKYGTANRVTGNSTAEYFGSRNFINGSGTGTKYGVYSEISSSVGGTNNWAGYFIGKNYISERLSIGVTDNSEAAIGVTKNSGSAYAHVMLTETVANNGARIRFRNSAETGSTEWTLNGRVDQTATNNLFNINHNGTGNVLTCVGDGSYGMVGIAERNPTTNRLEINGNASKTVTGAWLANSDSRLKKEIKPLSSKEMLEKVLKMQGVTYLWNDNVTGYQRPTEIQYGFIAQDLQQLWPTKVSKDNDGYLQTAYGDYDAMFVESIKALNTEIEQLKNQEAAQQQISTLVLDDDRISQLEAQNEELKAEIQSIRALLEQVISKKEAE